MYLLDSKNYKIDHILLYLSILFSPLRSYGYIIGGYNFSLFRIVGVLMILHLITFHRKIFLNTPLKIILLILFITILQVSYSPYISGSYSSFISQLFGFVWCFFACQIIMKTKVYNCVNTFILLSSIIPLLLGLYQWIYYKFTGVVPDLPFSFLVSSEGKLGLTYNVYMRITSCFGDPAYMTTFYVGVFSVAFSQLLLSNKNNSNSKFIKTLSVIIIILIVLETIMSISISGVIGLMISILLFFVLNMKRSKTFFKIFVYITLFGLAFILFFLTGGTELIDILKFKISRSTQVSSNLYGRSDYIKNALDVWLNNPILGGGFGSLRMNGSFSTAHSSLLTVLCQQGLIVFLFNVLLLIIYPFSYFFKTKTSDNYYIYNQYIGVFIGLISILALTLGYDTLYSLDSCYILIAAVSSYSVNYSNNSEDM